MISLNDISAILDRIVASTHTSADIETLQSLLMVSGDHKIVQVGKYNINIGHGENIQIGDRIYQGPDAESLRQLIHEVLKSYRLPSPAAPFQTPFLPLHFIPRPEESEPIKARLLASDDPPGVLVISAIHGLGGIGKSVLATALAHNPAVQEKFSDGVLWAVLGQEPDLIPLLGGWIQALGDYDFHAISIETASAHLRTLLKEKAVLLVVDDVWESVHLAPLLSGGPDCQALVTTRRIDVADEIGANIFSIEALTEAQALDLLSARLGRSLVNEERVKAAEIARVLGYLPLALELAAVRIDRGDEWSALHEALEREVARLEALEGPRARKKGLRLVATFNLSLNALRNEEESAWEAFVWLGVLPEDVLVTAPMTTTLWEMDQVEATETLELLWNDSLLLSGPTMRIAGQRYPTYRLHDLLHNIARRLLVAKPPHGLDLSLSQAHSSLLERYRMQIQDGLWHTLPDDGYIYAHLTWHFLQAGWEDQLHILLSEETSESRNGWFETRDRLGQIAGYLEDIKKAWKQAVLTGDVVLQVRYALCRSSLASLSANIPASLLAWGTRHGLLSSEQALYLAQGKPEALSELASVLQNHSPDLLKELLVAVGRLGESRYSGGKGQALIGLVPHLPKDLLQEAYEIAKKIKDEHLRAQSLVGVIPYLSEDLQEEPLNEALASARKIEWIESRARALGALIPFLSEPLRASVTQEMFELAKGIDSEVRRKSTIQELKAKIGGKSETRKLKEEHLQNSKAEINLGNAWRSRTGRHPNEVPDLVALVSEGRLDEALEIVCNLPNYNGYAVAVGLTLLAPHLSDKLLEVALSAACELDEHARFGCPIAEALIGLAPHLPPKLLKTAFVAACTIKEVMGRAQALAGLAPYLTEKLLVDALEASRNIEYEPPRERAIWSLVPHLQKDLLGEALAAMREIGDRYWRAQALVKLAPYLSEDSVETIRESISDIHDNDRRVDSLIALIPYLSANLQSHKIIEALNMATDLGEPFGRNDKLIYLTAQLPASLMDETLIIARNINDHRQRVWFLVSLIPHLPAQLLEEVIIHAKEIDGKELKVELFSSLIPYVQPLVAEELLYETLDLTRSIESEWKQAQLIEKILPYFTEKHLKQALDIACQFEYERQARLIEKMLHYFTGDHLERVLEIVDGFEGKLDSFIILAKKNPDLNNMFTEEMFSTVLDTILQTDDLKTQSHTVAKVAPYLSESQLERILNAVQSFEVEPIPPNSDPRFSEHRTTALRGLIPYLPERLLGEAFNITLNLNNPRSQGSVFILLVPRMPQELLQKNFDKIVDTLNNIDYAGARAAFLTILSLKLPKHMQQGLLDNALAAMESANFESLERGNTDGSWSSLVPLLPEHLINKALESLQKVDKYRRDSALTQLATNLSEQVSDNMIETVLYAVSKIEGERERSDALVGLAPRLSGNLLNKALLVARDINDTDIRGRFRWRAYEYRSAETAALMALASRWSTFDNETVNRLWITEHDGVNILQRLASRRRRYFLFDICALVPVLLILEGEDVIEKVFQSVQDVTRWWP
ncbi:MAG: NB-ARC domain-containing protein [Chloroflexota bacterium]